MEISMLTHPTHERLITLGLIGMAKALEEQRRSPDLDALSFEERVGLLVDREAAERDTKRLTTRLKFAALRQSACVEDVDLRTPRGIDRAVFARLIGGDWINRNENLLITGATGLGKSWIACALGHKACRDNRSVQYHRVPRLFEALALARGDGRYGRMLKTLGRVQLLILDDWGLSILNPSERRDLLEILDDRHGRASTIVTSQIPVEHWHEIIGDPMRGRPRARRRSPNLSRARTPAPLSGRQCHPEQRRDQHPCDAVNHRLNALGLLKMPAAAKFSGISPRSAAASLTADSASRSLPASRPFAPPRSIPRRPTPTAR